MQRLIIVGSPRTNGRSAHLAEMLFEANIDEHPEDELFLVPVSEVEIGPCIGCNACRKKTGVVLKDDDGNEVIVQKHRCIFDDDMQMLYDLIDDVDEVSVVSPVYFSGAPAPFKCVLDRLQPYFWARIEARQSSKGLPEKRPLSLHVLGEGGDPHGYDALVSEVKSAFATADFRLERVLDWIGKIDESGEITDEAVEIDLMNGTSSPDEAMLLEGSDASPAIDGFPKRAAGKGSGGVRGGSGGSSPSRRAKQRPKLNLRSGMQDAQRASGGAQKGGGQKGGGQRSGAQRDGSRKGATQKDGAQMDGSQKGGASRKGSQLASGAKKRQGKNRGR